MGDEEAAGRALARAAALLAQGRAGKARRWLHRAGQATTDPRVSYLVAHAFHTRIGDLAEAEAHYLAAATAGHVEAMNNLGVLLTQRGDTGGAARWLLRAAEHGDLDATHTYARLLHRTGRETEALPWYEKAASAGHVDGMMNAGTLLLARGDGAAALRWFRAAQRAGHPLAGMLAERAERPGPPPRPRPARKTGPPLEADPATPLKPAYQAQERFLSTGDPTYLALGIDLLARLLDAGLPREIHADALTLRGVLLRTRYARDGRPQDIADAVAAGRAATDLAQESDPRYASHLTSLGNTLHDDFLRSRRPSTIAEAVSLHRRALATLPDEHPDRVPTQSNLANALLAQATGTGGTDEATVTEAVLTGREVVRATPDGHPRLASYLVNLAAALLALLRLRPSNVIADETARTYDRALLLLPQRHPSRARLEENRRLAHQIRDALHATAGPVAPPLGTATADRLLARYETHGAAADLDRALEIYRTAHATTLDPAARRETGVKLATALWSLAERTGARADLDASLDLFAALLAEIPDGDPLSGTARTSLGSLHRMRWESGGDPADLDAAIAHQRIAIADAPPGHPMRALRLDALASALTLRHDAYGDTAALEESLALRRQALDLTGIRSPQGPGIASNLATGLYQRPDATRADLDEAVALARAAVTATPPSHPLHARFLSNLALVLSARHAFSGVPGDADEAARHAAQAVAATPLDHPNRLTRLGALATARVQQYEAAPTPGGLDDLVRAARAADEATPPGHVSHTHVRSLHAWTLARKALATGDDDALAASEETLRQAATDPAGPVRARAAAARRWASTAHLAHGPAAALGPFAYAVDLLARTAPRRIGRTDQERHLASHGGLASDAAACALACGAPERAVELLEAGRGVLLAQTADTRGDLTRLREAHPDLARRLDALRAVLDPPPGARDHTQDDRYRADAQWDALVADIRSRPGFARFLLPPAPADLLAALGGRTAAVLVNISGLRSDALLLDGGRVTALPLPGMDLATVTWRATAFATAVAGAADPAASRAARVAHQGTVRDTLAWLWRDLAEPVLTALGHTAPPPGGSDAWPRLCWIPTGPLTALPLHAAEAPGTGAVLDRVVSSYAPTLRSLVRTPDAPSAMPGDEGPLVVALPETPGAPALPHVREEARYLAAHPGAHVLSGPDATRAAVLAAIPRHAWVHLACHAQSPDTVLLHDHATRRLTVPDISALRLPAARLAYLSACATTRALPDLADEAVHITGAFQLAGYPHVIGTLWPIADRIAGETAAAFYAAWRAGADPARALHDAVRGVRARLPGAPTLWAAHVHVSAAG